MPDEMKHIGKLIYLDHYRLQEPDLPPLTLCGGLVRPYVVDPSVPPIPRTSINTVQPPIPGYETPEPTP